MMNSIAPIDMKDLIQPIGMKYLIKSIEIKQIQKEHLAAETTGATILNFKKGARLFFNYQPF